MVPNDIDICVIGSGPAGAVTARKLALLGHDVCLIERHSFPRSHVGESLPPSMLPLLDSLGLRPRIEAAGFLRPHRAIVRWAQAEAVDKLQPGEPGFQVDRGEFDRILRDAAVEAGARLIQPAKVVQPVRSSQHHWTLTILDEAETSQIRTRYVVDASGRRSLLRGRKRRLSAPTTAIYAYWRNTALSGPETRVEAGSHAWFWGAPLPDGRANATVFVDPKHCNAHRGRDLQPFYRALLADSTLFRGCLEGQLVSDIRLCNASSYLATSVAGDDWIKVGEAAFSIDPLSSQGVQTAMQTGLQAAIVANTILRTPANTQAAIDFYEARQTERTTRHHAIAIQYYAEQYRFCPTPFWYCRSRDAGLPVADRAWPRQPSPPALDEMVRLCEATRIIQTPVMQDTYVVYHPALTHPALDRPVAFLHGVALAPLLYAVNPGQRVRDILALWSQDLPRSRAVEILQWLWTKGILVPFQEKVYIEPQNLSTVTKPQGINSNHIAFIRNFCRILVCALMVFGSVWAPRLGKICDGFSMVRDLSNSGDTAVATRRIRRVAIPPLEALDILARTMAPDSEHESPIGHHPRLTDRDETIFLLHTAAEIEHPLLVQYLYAMYSLKSADELSDPQQQAFVTAWRDTLRQIALEEMGHLVTVQ